MRIIASFCIVTLTVGAVAWMILCQRTLALARAIVDEAELRPFNLRASLGEIAPPVAIGALGLLAVWT